MISKQTEIILTDIDLCRLRAREIFMDVGTRAGAAGLPSEDENNDNLSVLAMLIVWNFYQLGHAAWETLREYELDDMTKQVVIYAYNMGILKAQGKPEEPQHEP